MNSDHTPVTGIPLGAHAPQGMPGVPVGGPAGGGGTGPHGSVPIQPWLTNTLIGVVLLVLGGGGIVGKDAYDDLRRQNDELRQEIRDMHSVLTTLTAREETDRGWRAQHESHTHDKTTEGLERAAAARSVMAARITALELTLADLERRMQRTSRR